jgi:adenine-specific DNA-methyltransferase
LAETEETPTKHPLERDPTAMPELHWNGKEAVQNHHHTVPIRTLNIDAPQSHPKNVEHTLDDNLIITGDNLAAMKALLPKYAGKVDVIYIDPPYNTGNEGWVYNDNVNSPMLKNWLGNTVGTDDLERHDKWLCMMLPRLQLMKQLLNMGGGNFC